MANNQLAWQQIQPNHQGSNQMQNIAGDTLSKAGTIFDRTAEYFQKENDRIQRDRALLAQERERTFNSLGKQLSDEAMQYATEATTDKNGVVSHQFNANKFNDYIANRSAELGYQSLSPEDQASIWSGMNINKNYEQGMKNNQYNEENRLERDKLWLDNWYKNQQINLEQQKMQLDYGKKYDENNKENVNKMYNFYRQQIISALLNTKNTSELPNNLDEILPNMEKFISSLPSDNFERQNLELLLKRIRDEEFRSKVINGDITNMNEILGYLNFTPEELKGNSMYPYATEEDERNKRIKTMSEDINYGIYASNKITNYIETNFKGYNTKGDLTKVMDLVNAYSKYLIEENKNPDDIVPNLFNKIFIKDNDDRELIVKGDIDDIMNDLLKGINSEEVTTLFGKMDDKSFNRFVKSVRDYNNIKEQIQETGITIKEQKVQNINKKEKNIDDIIKYSEERNKIKNINNIDKENIVDTLLYNIPEKNSIINKSQNLNSTSFRTKTNKEYIDIINKYNNNNNDNNNNPINRLINLSKSSFDKNDIVGIYTFNEIYKSNAFQTLIKDYNKIQKGTTNTTLTEQVKRELQNLENNYNMLYNEILYNKNKKSIDNNKKKEQENKNRNIIDNYNKGINNGN